ncbi:MAG: DUF4232 domain-containing protein [Thermoleophilia bacterium]
MRITGALAAAGTLLLGGIAGHAGAAPPAADRSAVAVCHPPALVVWLDTRGDGAAGSTFYDLVFTNLSARTCRLSGYPGVSAVTAGGARLGRPAGRDTTRAPRAVRLAPGASAVTTLRIVDVLNYPAALCRPVMAAGLRVYPPGSTRSARVPFPFRACSRGGPQFLSVRAVRIRA